MWEGGRNVRKHKTHRKGTKHVRLTLHAAVRLREKCCTEGHLIKTNSFVHGRRATLSSHAWKRAKNLLGGVARRPTASKRPHRAAKPERN